MESTKIAVIGSRIKVKFQTGAEKVFEIVDFPAEIAPEKGIISKNTPLARALLGRRVGEKINYEVVGRSICGEVVAITA